ncbi:MAG: cytochrome bd ubiquinol oxidase subunit [Solirubrobacteraceae bacterium]|jgi:cytochrome d ubiquinol oxidase subunit II|nr:cytochrome bd ubiquinol oxidase subunit [Solirubrobacteraceae bacterium]
MLGIGIEELPLFFALQGVALYAILAGADFGAGIWQLLAGRGEQAARIRDHAHHSMAPVWEANHVWLIFVLVVVWTGYPQAFASIASTLAVALTAAGIGIILRGVAYALRSASRGPAEVQAIDTLTAVGSVMAPFALAAAAGAIASQRVPVGNAAGDLWSSWLNPTSLLAGLLALLSSAYLAAVYLAADARREGDEEMVEAFRTRALVTGVLAGLAAIAGAVVVRSDARWIFDRLVDTPAVLSVAVSLLAGAATLVLVARRSLGAARISAAVAVAAVVGGWALAQNPQLLPGMTVQQAAAPDNVMVLLVISILAGGAILFPSLALLFRLVLRGSFSEQPRVVRGVLIEGGAPLAGPTSGLTAALTATRLAGACFVIGATLLVLGDSAWPHAAGVAALAAFIILGLSALAGEDARE